MLHLISKSCFRRSTIKNHGLQAGVTQYGTWIFSVGRLLYSFGTVWFIFWRHESAEFDIIYFVFLMCVVCLTYFKGTFSYRIRCSSFVSAFNGIALCNRYFNFLKSIRPIDASSWSLLSVLFKVFFFFHVSESDFPYRSCKCSFSVFCLFSYLLCCRPHIFISFFFGKVFSPCLLIQCLPSFVEFCPSE